MNAQKNVQQRQQGNLSFHETIQQAKIHPELKQGIIIALIGVAVVAASLLFSQSNIRIVVSFIGIFVSYSGFDAISRVIAKVQAALAEEKRGQREC